MSCCLEEGNYHHTALYHEALEYLTVINWYCMNKLSHRNALLEPLMVRVFRNLIGQKLISVLQLSEC